MLGQSNNPYQNMLSGVNSPLNVMRNQSQFPQQNSTVNYGQLPSSTVPQINIPQQSSPGGSSGGGGTPSLSNMLQGAMGAVQGLSGTQLTANAQQIPSLNSGVQSSANPQGGSLQSPNADPAPLTSTINRQAPTSSPDFFDENQTPSKSSAQPDFYKDPVMNVNQSTTPSTNSSMYDKLISGAQGVNNVIDKIPANVIPPIAGMFSQQAGQNATNYYNQRDIQQQQDMAKNPISGSIGKGVGELASALPAAGGMAAGLAPAALTGGIMGSLETNPNQGSVTHGVNTVVGAAGNALLPEAATVAQNIGRAAKYMFNGTSDLATQALQKAMGTAGDISKVTPEEFFNHADQLTQGAYKTKNDLYQGVKDLGDAEGVKVNMSPHLDDINFYSNSPNFTKTKQGQDILEKVNNNQPLTYSESQNLTGMMRDNAYSAYKRDPVLGKELTQLTGKMQNTIDSSGGSEMLKSANDQAKNFYHTTYAPLNDIGAKQVLADNFGTAKFLAPIMKNPQQMNALGQEGQQALLMAHNNALKAAATDSITGRIDPVKYTQSLADSIKGNQEMYNRVIPNLQALNGALGGLNNVAKAQGYGSKSIMEKILSGSFHAVPSAVAAYGGYEAGGVGGAIAGAAGGLALPKAMYLNAAGKMLQNKAATDLLNQSASLGDNASPIVKDYYNGKILNTFLKNASAMPSRLWPYFTGSSQSPEDVTKQQNTKELTPSNTQNVNEPSVPPNSQNLINNQQQKVQSVNQAAQQGTTAFKTAYSMIGQTVQHDGQALHSFFQKSGVNLNPSTAPWCAAFANAVLQASGERGTGSMAARSFLNYGTPTQKPSQGDIVVLSRGSDTSKGHVGFFAGMDGPDKVKILGGNQSNSVMIKSFPVSRVLGYRVPPNVSNQVQQNRMNNLSGQNNPI